MAVLELKEEDVAGRGFGGAAASQLRRPGCQRPAVRDEWEKLPKIPAYAAKFKRYHISYGKRRRAQSDPGEQGPSNRLPDADRIQGGYADAGAGSGPADDGRADSGGIRLRRLPESGRPQAISGGGCAGAVLRRGPEPSAAL